MSVTAQTEAPVRRRRRRRSLGSYVMPTLASGLVLLLLFWLAKNAQVDGFAYFVQIALIGVTLGAVYALVALGYTLVYGILELINFAHGDVVMMGGMFSITYAVDFFGLHSGQGI